MIILSDSRRMLVAAASDPTVGSMLDVVGLSVIDRGNRCFTETLPLIDAGPVKTAITSVSALTVITVGFVCPERAPSQWLKYQLSSGMASNCTTVPYS